LAVEKVDEWRERTRDRDLTWTSQFYSGTLDRIIFHLYNLKIRYSTVLRI